MVDKVRHALLATGTYRAPAGSTDTFRASASAVISSMREMGYVIGAPDESGTYHCSNPEHDPTPEQFAARRHKTVHGSTAPPLNGTNGDAPRVMRGRVRRPVLSDVLPGLGTDLVVVMVGFGRDDRPTLVLHDDHGNRFTCAVEQIESAAE